MMKPYGLSKLWGMILVLLLVVLAVVAHRVVPVYVNAYDFKDAMGTQAKFASVDKKPHEAIREELYRKAQELDLPIEREQIKINQGPEGTTIATKFKVPVDLPFLLQEVEFNFSVNGQ